MRKVGRPSARAFLRGADGRAGPSAVLRPSFFRAFTHLRERAMTSIATPAVPDETLPRRPLPAGHRSPVAVPPALSTLAERIADRSATVAVVGLGYVGLPLLVAAGAEGFRLIGVDPDAEKVNGLRRGNSHVVDVSSDD